MRKIRIIAIALLCTLPLAAAPALAQGWNHGHHYGWNRGHHYGWYHSRGWGHHYGWRHHHYW
ncbi:hypothetical protein [Rhodoblastus sp.]|jgi:hypothetical protein|uniref:hypothetical protein n=1 Tax=Rhodoblastus sp. TaxID=1962975 RepID=UPI0026065E84|nr:hypothetical protein [Rhodoblastus sp.]